MDRNVKVYWGGWCSFVYEMRNALEKIDLFIYVQDIKLLFTLICRFRITTLYNLAYQNVNIFSAKAMY